MVMLATTLPSLVLAVIVTVPFFIPLTIPLLSTVAIDSSLLDHIKSRLVAFSGSITALICVKEPVSIVDLSVLKFILLTYFQDYHNLNL